MTKVFPSLVVAGRFVSYASDRCFPFGLRVCLFCLSIAWMGSVSASSLQLQAKGYDGVGTTMQFGTASNIKNNTTGGAVNGTGTDNISAGQYSTLIHYDWPSGTISAGDQLFMRAGETGLGSVNSAGWLDSFGTAHSGNYTVTSGDLSAPGGIILTFYFGTPPATSYCIDVQFANNTDLRCKYTLSVVATGAIVYTTPYLNPGGTLTYTYCPGSGNKTDLKIDRFTEGNYTGVSEYTASIASTDTHWYASGGSGSAFGASDSVNNFASAANSINFGAGGTAAQDSTLQGGFKALYGQSAEFNDFQKGLLISMDNSGKSDVANTASIATSSSLTATSVGALAADVGSTAAGSIKYKLDTINSTASSAATQAHTDAAAINSSLTSLSSGGLATSANQVTANSKLDAINSTASSASTQAHTDTVNVNAAVTGASTQAHTDASAIQTKLDSLVAFNSSSAATRDNQLVGNGSLSAIESHTGALPGEISDLMDKVDVVATNTLFSRMTNFANLSQVQSLYDGMQAAAVAQYTATSNALTGYVLNYNAGVGDVSTPANDDDSWKVTIVGHVMDLNPMHINGLDAAAAFLRRLLNWLLYFTYLTFILKMSYDALKTCMITPQVRGTQLSLAGFGSTLPGATIAFVVIAGVLTAVAGLLLAFESGDLVTHNAVFTNPLTSSHPWVQRGLWLLDQFFPMQAAMKLAAAGLAYRVAMIVTVYANGLIVKAMLACFVGALLTFQSLAIEWRFRNGSAKQVFVEYDLTASEVSSFSTGPKRGAFVPAGSALDLSYAGAADLTSVFRYWYRASASDSWATLDSSGASLSALGIEDSTGQATISFVDDASSAGPLVAPVVTQWDPYYAFRYGVNWMAPALAGAVGLYIIRQVRQSNHSHHD